MDRSSDELVPLDVEEVTVMARKPTLIAGVLKLAGVRITRTRGDLHGV